MKPNRSKNLVVTSDFLPLFEDIIALKQEHLLVLSLSGTQRLLACHKVFVGSVDAVMADPREIFARALEDRASTILIAHNHPFGEPAPSAADVTNTQNLVAAGIMLRLHVYDHLIITAEGYFSFREKGML